MFLDNLKIGLVDESRFLQVLTKIPGIPLNTIEDNFHWQYNILLQLRQFIKDTKVNCEDLFRLVDTDFDMIFTVVDLKKFLEKELHVRPSDLKEAQLERLYKLLDVNKHNTVNREEFQKVFNQLQSSDSDHFDWKK